MRVALTTGFDRSVAVPLLESIGWGSGVLDAVVGIDDVRDGRPAPYLIFHAMEATGVTDVAAVLVAGDTVRDATAGRRAGASLVIAVRTGHVPEESLAAAGPTHVLDSVADLPDLLGMQPVEVAREQGRLADVGRAE